MSDDKMAKRRLAWVFLDGRERGLLRILLQRFYYEQLQLCMNVPKFNFAPGIAPVFEQHQDSAALASGLMERLRDMPEDPDVRRAKDSSQPSEDSGQKTGTDKDKEETGNGKDPSTDDADSGGADEGKGE